MHFISFRDIVIVIPKTMLNNIKLYIVLLKQGSIRLYIATY